jgi:23S rRNA-intervening sequence protein
MNRVEDLDAFKLAHELALRIYSTTKGFPKRELFSPIEQTRRAATSLGMNLMPQGKCVINFFSRGI